MTLRRNAVSAWGLLTRAEYAHIRLLLLNLPLDFVEVSEHLTLKKSFPVAVDVPQTYPEEVAIKDRIPRFSSQISLLLADKLPQSRGGHTKFPAILSFSSLAHGFEGLQCGNRGLGEES